MKKGRLKTYPFLFTRQLSRHMARLIKVGRKIGKITGVDSTTKAVRYVTSTGEKDAKRLMK